MDNARIWYVNIFVTNFQNALAFYRDTSPAKQPWGRHIAMLEDPDGNVFYLDQLGDES